MRVGVLALQGGFAAHLRALTALGHEAIAVRTPEQLALSGPQPLDGLCLPGGESTTHLRLIDRFNLAAPLNDFIRSGRPLLATCAGLILAAETVTDPEQPSYGWLPVTVARNAWGRQVHSFQAHSDAPLPNDPPNAAPIPLIFIRAPRITQVDDRAEVLATVRGEPILVRAGPRYGATFHPELTPDLRVHRLVFG